MADGLTVALQGLSGFVQGLGGGLEKQHEEELRRKAEEDRNRIRFIQAFPQIALQFPENQKFLDRLTKTPGFGERALNFYSGVLNRFQVQTPQATQPPQGQQPQPSTDVSRVAQAVRGASPAAPQTGGAFPGGTFAVPASTIPSPEQVPAPPARNLAPVGTLGVNLGGGLRLSVSGEQIRDAKVRAIYNRNVAQARAVSGGNEDTAIENAIKATAREVGLANLPEIMQRIATTGLRVKEAGAKAAVSERARREVRIARPISPEEDIAATVRSLGLKGAGALEAKKAAREAVAAGIAAAKHVGAVMGRGAAPSSMEDAVVAEAVNRGLVAGSPEYNDFVGSEIERLKETRAQRAQIARSKIESQFRPLSADTLKVLQSTGIVKSGITGLRKLIADPVLGPEFMASRGPLSGRLVRALRKFGVFVGEGNTKGDILISQMEIIGVQPYLRGMRRYDFVQDARQHLPAPQDPPRTLLLKLETLERLLGDYQELALFWDTNRSPALIDEAIRSGRVPHLMTQEDIDTYLRLVPEPISVVPPFRPGEGRQEPVGQAMPAGTPTTPPAQIPAAKPQPSAPVEIPGLPGFTFKPAQ